jgi:hypothetical protein
MTVNHHRAATRSPVRYHRITDGTRKRDDET